MNFNNNDDDDRNDYFDGPDIPEAPVKPKPPVYSPDDPEYWAGDESEWEHLKPRRKIPHVWLWTAVACVAVGLCVALYIRYFSPYVEDVVEFGYVDHIEKRGTIFKTYEGVLIPYKEMMDTSRVYTRDFIFSCDNSSLGRKLVAMQGSGIPVKVGYKVYHAVLPWRGASKTIVVSVDSIDPARILPLDRIPL